MANKRSFIYRNGLSIVLVLLFVISIIGQILTGWREHNEERKDLSAEPRSLTGYLRSGHFIQSTFENWESEFLQMAIYVLLTIFLRQQGSSESKSLTETEEVDREPDPDKKDAPWPVKKGGFILSVYKSSLSIAFLALFLASFVFHAYGSLKDHNEEQILKGKAPDTIKQYMGQPRFWFESFQNWQSEFVSVAAIVILSIFLRQQGSPESKPVDAPHSETGSG
jgi:hypothetical protein